LIKYFTPSDEKLKLVLLATTVNTAKDDAI